MIVKMDLVVDPDGDDIEDGLTEAAPAPQATGGAGPSVSNESAHPCDDEKEAVKDFGVGLFRDLPGWNQAYPKKTDDFLDSFDNLVVFSLGFREALTNDMALPDVCTLCRTIGHTFIDCKDKELPMLMAVRPDAHQDDQQIFTNVAKFIHEHYGFEDPRQNFEARKLIIAHIEEFLQDYIPECYLTLFGSSDNGFCLNRADLDICLKLKGKEEPLEAEETRELIVEVTKILETYKGISKVVPITGAKVPIIKFFYDPANLEADISIFNTLAEHNTRLLRAYSLIDKRVRELGSMLKHFMKKCDVADASRGSLSSYAYVIMLIHFLQQRNVVPVLQEMPPIGHPAGTPLPQKMMGKWNVYYFDQIESLGKVWRSQNKETTGQLWLAFFEYYSAIFPFHDQVITIRRVQPMRRLEKMWTRKPIAIEDPFELDHNLGVGINYKMGRFLFALLIHARNWFLHMPSVPIQGRMRSPRCAYEYFFDIRKFLLKRPPVTFGCKFCHEIGHWIKDCPALKARLAAPILCRICKGEGHITKKCPNRAVEKEQAAKNAGQKAVATKEASACEPKSPIDQMTELENSLKSMVMAAISAQSVKSKESK